MQAKAKKNMQKTAVGVLVPETVCREDKFIPPKKNVARGTEKDV